MPDDDALRATPERKRVMDEFLAWEEARKADPSTPPPGWYADPKVPETERYWAGTAWSDVTRPRPSPGQTPTPYPRPPGYGDPQPQRRQLTMPMIAVGVALGIAAVLVVIVALAALAPNKATASPCSQAQDATNVLLEASTMNQLDATTAQTVRGVGATLSHVAVHATGTEAASIRAMAHKAGQARAGRPLNVWPAIARMRIACGY